MGATMGRTWFKPQGSKREGIIRMSTPAMILCATGTEKPTPPAEVVWEFLLHVAHLALNAGDAAAEHDDLTTCAP